MLLLLLLSRFSRVRLCATPYTAAYKAPPSLGFSRQEHWSGLPFPSPMHESEKWKWSHAVLSDSSRPHGLQPTRLLYPWDFPGKSTGMGCHCYINICYNLTNLESMLNERKQSAKNDSIWYHLDEMSRRAKSRKESTLEPEKWEGGSDIGEVKSLRYRGLGFCC